MKKRFSGRQQSKPANVANPALAPDAATLEKEVAAQGDVVRNLKASKADKTAIESAVAKLLDLKKQLAACQAPAAAVPAVTESKDVAQLEKDISLQGDVVRKLKADKADKKVIDEAVAKLLDLKKQLSAATGQAPAAAQSGSNKKNGGKKKWNRFNWNCSI